MEYTTTQIDIITQLAVWVNSDMITYMDNLVVIEGKWGQLHIDFNKKEIGFVDFNKGMKTYFAIVGFASCRDFTTEDYFTE